jgi:hypothetical protein
MMHMKPVRLPVVAFVLASALAAAPAALAATRPPGPAMIIGHGHGMNLGRTADPQPPGLPSVAEPGYTSKSQGAWAGWSDVADANVDLRFVTANFVVPTVTCLGRDDEADFWVGLDGAGEGKTVEQIGVDAFCDISLPSGGYAPDYTSWWEMYPDGVHTVGNVSPGDQIAVSVYYDSSTGNYDLALSDSNSTGADFNKPESCPSGSTCHNATAEVIAEDPGGGASSGVNLAKFSKLTFSQIGVTSRDGTHGTLEGNSLWSSVEWIMAYKGDAMATPSARNDGATSFTVTWNGSN